MISDSRQMAALQHRISMDGMEYGTACPEHHLWSLGSATFFRYLLVSQSINLWPLWPRHFPCSTWRRMGPSLAMDPPGSTCQLISTNHTLRDTVILIPYWALLQWTISTAMHLNMWKATSCNTSCLWNDCNGGHQNTSHRWTRFIGQGLKLRCFSSSVRLALKWTGNVMAPWEDCFAPRGAQLLPLAFQREKDGKRMKHHETWTELTESFWSFCTGRL